MKSSFNKFSEYFVSLLGAGLPEDHEPSTGSCLKGDCLCKDHDTKVHFIHWFLMLFLGMKKGRNLSTTDHKDLFEMEQLQRWQLHVY